MELVDGDDLSQRIAKGALPIKEAVSIARQIADALEAAHEQGIVDRDLATLPPSVPASIRQLLARCLEKDPRRHQCVRQSRRISPRSLLMERCSLAGRDRDTP